MSNLGFDADPIYARLLSSTVQHAFDRCIYYKDAFRGINLHLEKTADLARFPILNRQTVKERALAMLASGIVPDLIRHTSGTGASSRLTGPLAIFRLQREADAAVNDSLIKDKSSSLRPLMLRFISIDNGADLAAAIPGVFPVAMETPVHFTHACELLRMEFSLPDFSPRIVGLTGTLNRLKIFTAECMRRGIDPADFGLSFIACHSQVLTSRWRKIITDFWKVAPTEVYGISEIPGFVGTRCPVCAGYHLSPSVFVETLHPKTFKPVTTGVARLVATALLPLAEAHPLVRYDTEEIVELKAPCNAAQQMTFEYVGRSSDVVLTEGQNPKILVSPMQLHNIIDEYADVAIQPFRIAKNFQMLDVGHPKYKLSQNISNGRLDITIDIEVRWNPALYPELTLGWERTFRQKISTTRPDLAHLLKQGDISLNIKLHPPGSLIDLTDA